MWEGDYDDLSQTRHLLQLSRRRMGERSATHHSDNQDTSAAPQKPIRPRNNRRLNFWNK
jgi:hypothetical protein